MKKSLAIILCLAMLLGVLAGCSGANDKPLVAGYSNSSSKFSPFFSETAYDQDVWYLTAVQLLDVDRLGAVIEKGKTGETKSYNGHDYTYYGPADLTITTNADGTVSLVEYSPYQGQLYGVPGKGKTGSISVDLSNNIEMKLKNDDDSVEFKKVSIIDELGASVSYNLATDIRPLSDVSTRLRLKLTKSYTLNLNAVFASYVYEADSVGGAVRVSEHTTYWQQGKLGRFQGMSQNLSYTLDNTKVANLFKWLRGEKPDKKDKNNKKKSDENGEDEYDTGTETNVDTDLEAGKHGARKENAGKAETDEDGYMSFSMPWSLSFGYGVTMRENTDQTRFNYSTMRYPYKFTQNLNISGNIRISDGWNISFSSGYDFENKKISMTTASLGRDLHCFNMSCSVVLAPYTSYNFSFRCNASTLTDALKYDKRSSYSNSVRWY